MDYSKIIDAILDKEVYFHFAKSGGKWGQNVNKRETKAELYFNIRDTRYLNSDQKKRLIQCAGHMIHHNEWILIMTDQEERLQVANKEKVIHHFRELMNHILPEPKKRLGTKAPAWVEDQRKQAKQYRSTLKQWRSMPIHLDD
jgi:ribosome-associated protein